MGEKATLWGSPPRIPRGVSDALRRLVRPVRDVDGWDGSRWTPTACNLDMFIERRLWLDVLNLKTFGVQAILTALVMQTVAGVFDFVVHPGAATASGARASRAVHSDIAELSHRYRFVDGAVLLALVLLVLHVCVRAKRDASTVSRAVRAWRISLCAVTAVLVGYQRAVLHLAERSAATEALAYAVETESAPSLLRLFAQPLLEDARRLADGVAPPRAAGFFLLALSYNAELHASSAQGIASVFVAAAAFSTWTIARCASYGPAGQLRLAAAAAAASVGTALHLKGKHDAAFAEYERRRILSDDLSQLAGVKSDTKNFMAFLFHEIRAPLSVVSLGVPVLRDQISSARRDEDPAERDERAFAAETADLMGRSMDVVQRVMRDTLDLMNSAEVGQGSLEPRWTNLIALVENAVRGSEQMFERGGATLRHRALTADPEGHRLASRAMFVDPSRVRRALDAVLASASGVTHPKGMTTVTVHARPMRAAPQPGSPALRAAAALPELGREWVLVDIRIEAVQADLEVEGEGDGDRRAARGDGTTTADELLRMLREPLHRVAGGAARGDAFMGETNAGANARVFAPAAAALDLHVARMMAELHGGKILVRDLQSSLPGNPRTRDGTRGTVLILRIPALTRPMDERLVDGARGAGTAPAAAGPWENPFLPQNAPNSPAARVASSLPRSLPVSRRRIAGNSPALNVDASNSARPIAERAGVFRQTTRDLLQSTATRLEIRRESRAEADTESEHDGAPTVEATAAKDEDEETGRRRFVLAANNASRVGPGAFIPSAQREGNNRFDRYDRESQRGRGSDGGGDGDENEGSPSTRERESPGSDARDLSAGGGGGSKRARVDEEGVGDGDGDRGGNRDRRRSRDMESSPSADESGDRPRMLVVEDSAPTRKMLVNLLRQLGIDSREASNGLEALRACAAVTSEPGGSAATPFDAILMDKEMPVMDGHQATEQLRRMGVKSPIVGITANVLRVDREAFMAKGLSAYVPKPVQRQDLVQTLQSFGLCGCDPFRATDRTARAEPPKRPKPENERREDPPVARRTRSATRRR